MRKLAALIIIAFVAFGSREATASQPRDPLCEAGYVAIDPPTDMNMGTIQLGTWPYCGV